MRLRKVLPACFLQAALALTTAAAASGQSRIDSFGNRGGDPAGADLKKSALSLVVPGLAQMRMGETNRGLVFMAAEAGFWAGFAVFRVQGSLRRDSYIEMAGLFAGVPGPEGRGEEYYRRISNWSSSDAYNEMIRREARARYGDDLEGREAYFEANRVAPDAEWRWESFSAQQRYREKRRDSAAAYKNARNMLGMSLANRVISMLDAALLARRQDLSLAVTPGDEPASARLSLTFTLP